MRMVDASPGEDLTKWSRHVPGLQLAWSANSLRSFATCPRRYQYEHVIGRRVEGSNTNLEFGSLFHGALETFDRARCGGADVATSAREALRYVLAHSGARDDAGAWTAWRGEGKKTRHTLIRAVIWYCDAQRDDGNVQPYAFPDGTAAVELEFRLPLGKEVKTSTWTHDSYGTVYREPYLLVGYLDSLATFAGQTFVRERKTTEKTLGSYYFDNFSPDPQIDTYSVAADILFPELKIAGVLLEATQTAAQFARFHVQPLHRTPEQREEWLGEILGIIDDAERCARSGFWPRRTAVCGLYGGCPYRKVCGRSPGVRDSFLASADFVDRETREETPL